jgi:hypothetical protein
VLDRVGKDFDVDCARVKYFCRNLTAYAVVVNAL